MMGFWHAAGPCEINMQLINRNTWKNDILSSHFTLVRCTGWEILHAAVLRCLTKILLANLWSATTYADNASLPAFIDRTSRCCAVQQSIDNSWSSWCHCHPKTPSSLASYRSRPVLPFWYRLRPYGAIQICLLLLLPTLSWKRGR